MTHGTSMTCLSSRLMPLHSSQSMLPWRRLGAVPSCPTIRHADAQWQHITTSAARYEASSSGRGRGDGARGRGRGNRGGRGDGRGSRGRGRGRDSRDSSARDDRISDQQPMKRMWNGRWVNEQDSSSDDFVVVGRAESAGSYRKDLDELQGSSFWEAATEDEEEGEMGEAWEEEGEEDEEDGGFLAALQELLPDLEEPGETEEQAEWRRVYTTQVLPRPHWGPMRLTHIKGQGRGVVATEALQPGKLLLVAPPLSVLYCEEGTTPENEDLADHMLQVERFTQTQLQQLEALAPRGGGTSPSLPLLSPEVLLALPQGEQEGQEQQERQGAAVGTSGSEVAAESEASPLSVPRDELCSVVNANCYGEAFEDGVLCALKGASSAGHVGIWPALAMVNHSCTPNAVAFAIGSRMVMRVAQDVAAGEQLTITYLGRGLTSPLAQRQAELQEVYGFQCSCSRCKAESRLAGGPVAALIGSVHERCQQLEEELEEAIEQRDGLRVEEIQGELLSLQAQLEGAMRTAKLSSKAKRWVQASTYDLYDLLSLCADQGSVRTPAPSANGAAPTVDTEAMAVCARILSAVAPGSSALCEVAVEYMLRAELKFGPEHQEASGAAALARAALMARYGAGGRDIGGRMAELLQDSHTMLSGEQGEDEDADGDNGAV